MSLGLLTKVLLKGVLMKGFLLKSLLLKGILLKGLLLKGLLIKGLLLSRSIRTFLSLVLTKSLSAYFFKSSYRILMVGPFDAVLKIIQTKKIKKFNFFTTLLKKPTRSSAT